MLPLAFSRRCALAVSSTLCALGALLLAWLALPAESEAANRPRIGLVLSGGGALGATHIGVLRVLEAHKVPIDVIAGTSMGAIVGGLYASGYSPDELEGLIRRIDWIDLFKDRPSRDQRPFRHKSDDLNYLVDFKLGFGDGSPRLPLGAIQGQKLILTLRSLTSRAHGTSDFDRLPIRFRAVAADLETGEPVVLGRGDLATAMRASMSVPGVLPPVVIDDRALLDGGVANNLPIDVARAMGADIVIISEIETVTKSRKDIGSALGVVNQMVSLLIRKTELEQLKTVRPGDIVIKSRLGDRTSVDFPKMGEMVAPGEAAAMERSAELTALAALAAGHTVSAPYPAVAVPHVVGSGDRSPPTESRSGASRLGGAAPSWTDLSRRAGDRSPRRVPVTVASPSFAPAPVTPAFVTSAPVTSAPVTSAHVIPGRSAGGTADEHPVIAFVEIVNESPLAEEVIRTKLRIKTGQRLELEKLEAGIAALYATDDFSRIEYRLEERAGQTGLVLTVIGKTWARNYFEFGLALETDFNGESAFNIGTTFTMTGLNPLGAEWRTGIQIGEHPGVFTQFYQPLDDTQSIFIEPRIGYAKSTVRGQGTGGTQAVYRTSTAMIELAGGLAFDSWGQLSVGTRHGFGDAELDVGVSALREFDFQIGQAFTRFVFDTLNDVHFPDNGAIGFIEYAESREALGASRSFRRIEASGNWANTWDRNTIMIGGRLGTSVDDTLPLEERFRLGGFLNLSGLQSDQLAGGTMGLGRLVYYRKLTSAAPELMDLPVYAGASIESGNVWTRRDDVGLDSLRYSGSVFLGADTPLGPLYLAYGLTDSGDSSAYLFLGRGF